MVTSAADMVPTACVVAAAGVMPTACVVAAAGVVAVMDLRNDSGDASAEAFRCDGVPKTPIQGQSLLQTVDGGAELASLIHVPCSPEVRGRCAIAIPAMACGIPGALRVSMDSSRSRPGGIQRRSPPPEPDFTVAKLAVVESTARWHEMVICHNG